MAEPYRAPLIGMVRRDVNSSRKLLIQETWLSSLGSLPLQTGLLTLNPNQLCYIMPETSFREHDGQHEWTGWEREFWGRCLPGFSGWRAVRFAVHFGIQTGGFG
jgi:hypothetical protein